MLRQHLVAIREQAKALIALCDLALAEAAPAPHQPGAPCSHPPESRVPAARMGAPTAFLCQTCGQEGS